MPKFYYFATLKERDTKLEELWTQFEDVPMDPDTECMEEPFLDFPAGTPREDIWHWFIERHSKGVAYLLYGDGVDRTAGLAELAYAKTLCVDCGSLDCAFCNDGICKFPLVYGHNRDINNEGGCNDYVFVPHKDATIPEQENEEFCQACGCRVLDGRCTNYKCHLHYAEPESAH